jgi:WD40 repeat protein/serine/threonine protein kinase/class 3 adenylate cyclase
MAETQLGSRLCALVFTDLAGSTALKSELGDLAVENLIVRHRDLVASIATATEGRIIDWAGDGCFLTFETPSSGVEFSLRLQQARQDDASLPSTRIGVHMGEVTESQLDGGHARIEGLAVDFAARICSLAAPGQILLSGEAFNSARQRLRGKEVDARLEWRAHGFYEIQGIDEPVHIAEVGIAGVSPLTPPPGSEKVHRAVSPSEEETLGWRPAVGLKVPRRDHWILKSQVGLGGFGEVWLTVHEKTREKRVFKFCFESERIRGLRREVVLFRLLKEALGDRKDIARVLDWDFEQPPYFLEAEYTEGGDLKDWADSRGGLKEVPLAIRIELLAQVAVALNAAHSVGVLHKDIKPSNILVSNVEGQDVPRTSLTDFGIGLITDREALVNMGITAVGLTDTLIASSTPSSGTGTRMYMAPELIEGKPATTLSDVYALGVMLYQIAAGDFRHAIASGWERDVEDPLIIEDIAACVDGNPERRLASAGELASRLRSLEKRRADRAAEIAKEREMKQSRRRKKQFVVASAIGISITVLFGLFALSENQRAQRQADLAAKEKILAAEEKILRIEAENARQEADEARASEAQLRAEAELGKYISDLSLVEQAVSTGDLPAAQNRLEKQIRRLRGWEWGYWVEKAFPVQENLVDLAVDIAKPLTTREQWTGTTPQLVATLTGPNAAVYDFDFSPAGSPMATRDRSGAVFMWQGTAFDRMELGTSVKSAGHVELSFAPVGDILAYTVDGGVHVYDLNAASVVARLPAGREQMFGLLEFSPDGSLLLAGDLTRVVFAWDWRQEELIWSRKIPEGYSPDGFFQPAWIGFTPDASHFVFAEDRTSLAVCSLETGEIAQHVNVDAPEGYYAVELTPQDNRIIYFNPEKNLYSVIGFPSGEPIGEPWFDQSDAGFGAIRSSNDGTTIAIRNTSSAIQLIGVDEASTPQFEALSNIKGVSPPDGGKRVNFSADGSLIAVPQADNSIAIFAPGQNEQLSGKTPYSHADSVAVVRFMGSDNKLATAAYDGTVRTWDLNTKTMISELQAHEDGIAELIPSPDFGLWMTNSYDGTYAVWNLETGTKLYSSPTGPAKDYGGGLRGPIVRLTRPILAKTQFSPDGENLMISSSNGGSIVLDTEAFSPRHTLDGHKLWVLRGEFSPDSALAVNHGQEPTARLWDAKTGSLIGVLESSANFVSSAFSPDSKVLVATHLDGRVTVWDTASAQKINDWKAHTNVVFTVEFDSNGDYFATSSSDGTAAIWDAKDYTLQGRCTGHSDFAIAAFFNPTGDRLLTLATDRTARIWDTHGNELLKIDTGENILNGTWSPSGRRIAVTTMEGQVFVYDSIPVELISSKEESGTALRDRVQEWRDGQMN